MTHRCLHCSPVGNNSRACSSGNKQGIGGNRPEGCEANGPGGGGGGRCAGGCGGVKLFGVRLTDGSSIKKSASMGNLSSRLHPSAPATKPVAAAADGYQSDDPAHHGPGSSARRGDRKKGVPWTEEEHRMFLIGLQKLGKGDWRGISRHYVMSRTATQVASHAQKYFIRQSHTGRRKRRSSLFDMPQDTANDLHSVHEDAALAPNYKFETEVLNSMPSLDLSLGIDLSPRDTTPDVREQAVVHPSSGFPPLIPCYCPTYIPVSTPLWPAQGVSHMHDIANLEPPYHHSIVKPACWPVKQPVHVDELAGVSHLNHIKRENHFRESSPTLSLNLLGEPSSQSACHAKPPISIPNLSKGDGNPIRAL